MASYIISEPTPSSTPFIRSGRGGAGNFHRRESTSASSTPSTSSSCSSASLSQASTLLQQSSSSSAPRRFFSGIGGAGNAHSASDQRPPRCLEDEYLHAAVRARGVKAGHCGIGGAGNVWRSGGVKGMFGSLSNGRGLRRKGSAGTLVSEGASEVGSEVKLIK